MAQHREPPPRMTPIPYQLDVEKLRALRKAKGLTRVELAKLAGTSAHTYSRWENGSIVPYEEEYALLIAVLEVGHDELLTDQPNPRLWG